MTTPLTKVIPYTSPTGLTFNATDIEQVDSKTQLKLYFDTLESFSEDFTDDTDFTYNSALAEFVGGKIQQKSQLPAAAVFGATYTTSVNSSWPTVIPTLNGAPTISAGKLVCTGSQGAAYLDASIGAVQNTGTLRCKYTPTYTGAPPTNVNIMGIRPVTGNADQIMLTNSPSGNNLRVIANNSAGTQVAATVAVASFSPVAGQSYELQLTWDTSTGTFRVFINGVLGGTYVAGAYTRGTTATRLLVGASASVYNTSEASFEDVVLFNTVKHTASYTPGYTLPETIYAETVATLPTFMPASPGLLRPASPPTSTEAGTPRYIVQGYYWDGDSWELSNDTYAQATSKADILTNIGTFPVTGAATIVVDVAMGASNTQSSVDQIDFAVQGELYPVTDPVVYADAYLGLDGFYSFAAEVESSGADAVKFLLALYDAEGDAPVFKYWDGSEWAVSDGSYAQSNTAAEINSNAEALDVSEGTLLRVYAFLHSATGQTTPTLTSVTINYNFYVVKPVPRECLVSGWVGEIDGEPQNAVVHIKNLTGFFHSGIRIPVSEVSVNTDINGYWEISLIETETVSHTYDFDIEYTDNSTGYTDPFTGVTIPDEDTADFATIAS